MDTLASVMPLIAGILGILTALVSLVKAIQAISQAKAVKDEADAIKAARVLTQAEREKEYQELKTQVAILKESNAATQKRLDEGSNEFRMLTEEMKTNNALLNRVLGALESNGFKVGR